jgi:hypothetical protein
MVLDVVSGVIDQADGVFQLPDDLGFLELRHFVHLLLINPLVSFVDNLAAVIDLRHAGLAVLIAHGFSWVCPAFGL